MLCRALLASIALGAIQIQAQTVYTPYAFTNFAGQPGGPGVADGTGQGARFHSPTAAAADGAGNIYVADSLNFTIRKITPAGVVTTIAGAAGVSGTNDNIGNAARFGSVYGGPQGIAVDSSTNIYVADTANYTIRKIAFVGTNWQVTTLAGTGGLGGTNDNTGSAARFSGPTSVAVGPDGNVYVTDGFAVRRVTPAGVVTTLAGSGNQAGTLDASNGVARFGSTFFGGPKGIAVDSQTNIYVTDTYNDTIRKVTLIGSDWVVTTPAGAAGLLGFSNGTNSAASFSYPWGATLDNAGNLYVSDSSAQTIRKIAFSGTNAIVSTIAGTVVTFGSTDGTNYDARFQTPYGMTSDSSGNLYVADFGNDEIRKMVPSGTNWVVSTLAGEFGGIGTADGVGNAAQFDIPHDVAVDSAGNVYVGDSFNHTIRKITPDGTVTTIAGSPGRKGYVDGVGTYQAAQFNIPIGISSDANGNFYVADNGNNTIRKITPDGTVTTIAGQAGITGNTDANGTNATFNNPYDTVVDSKGNIFVSDTVNRSIRKITPAGDVALFAGSPTRVQGTNDGVGTAAKFQAPDGLAIDSSDNLYVADQGADTIRKIAPDATVTTFAGLGKSSGTNDGVGSAARFNSPEDVAVDKAGNVYVADSGNDTIRKITPGGAVSTLAGTPNQSGTTDGTNNAALFSVPRAIAVDSTTNLYVTDAVNNCRVRKITRVGTNWVVTTLAGGGSPFGSEYSVDAPGTNAVFKNIYGLVVDSSTNIFAVDRGNDDIREITPAGVVTTFAGLPRQTGSKDGSGGGAQFDVPEQVAVDNSGNVYVVEFGDNMVRKISPNGTNWIVSTVAGSPYSAVGTNNGLGPDARFSGPFGLTVDNSGNLYVADTGNRLIRKITPSGTNWTVSTFAGSTAGGQIGDGTGTNAHFAGPIGLAADANGIYLADSSTVRKISYGAVVTTLAGCITCGAGFADGTGTNAEFWTARGVAVDHDGNLYVADQANDLVRKLSPSNGTWVVTTLGGVPGQASGADGVGMDARFNQPTGIAVDSSGAVYVVNSGENNVVKGTVASTTTPTIQFDTSAGGLIVSGGNFQMRVLGASSGSLVLEASTNLQNWVPIQTNSISGSPTMFNVPVNAGPYRFFRAYLLP